MQTSELIGPALDWAVAKCEGVDMQSFLWAENQRAMDGGLHYYNYSTNWLSGGPIIEREGIDLHNHRHGDLSVGWDATIDSWDSEHSGPTPLIAAMRCFVASKLGYEINVPEELL